MTLRELIALARRQSFDNGAPLLWTDPEWTDYANEAEREACRRAHLIVDSETADLCTFTLAIGAATIPRDPRVLRVRRILLGSHTRPLSRIDVRDLDICAPGWESQQGLVEAYVGNYSSGAIRLYRKTSIADTARLTVVRLPLDDMAKDDDEPEIPTAYHRKLVDHMLELAYQKQDDETRDPKKEADAAARFTASFGPARSAKDEAWADANFDYNDGYGEF